MFGQFWPIRFKDSSVTELCATSIEIFHVWALVGRNASNTLYDPGAEGGGYNLALASVPLH